VVAANLAAEMSVFPRVIKMVMSIVATRVVTDPTITFSMNVRSFRVTLLIAETGAGFAARTAFASVAALDLSCAAGRRRSVSWNVAAAHVRRTSAASALPATSTTALPAASTSLCKRRKRQNQENRKQTR
jgi:hypothetical protein